tara:strand:- start:188 stop:880 length:693 start_codon:yes stop_codon:yes gene_type:complete
VLLFDEELDQALDIGRFPLEVAFGSIGGAHVGLEEEETGVGEGPIFGECELLLVLGLDVGDHAFEVVVVADEFESGGGANALDGIEVVAAEEDAEVNELVAVTFCVCCRVGDAVLTCSRSMPSPSNTLSRWISTMGSFRCSLKVRCLRRMGVLKVSVSMSSLAAAYTFPPRASTAHCASASVGATMYGMPISFNSRWHSSLCSLVTRTVRLENFSTSSAVPVSFASSMPA